MVKTLGKNIKGYLSLLWGKHGPPSEKYTLSTKGVEEGALTEGTKKTGAAVTCRNCGEALRGRFCHVCGQRDIDYRRPYWTFVEDFTDDILSRDSRLWRTLAYILFMPGAMTREYVAGRRARFLPPIRFFFVTILIFFVTMSLLNVAIVKFAATPVTAGEKQAKLEEALAELDQEIAKLEAQSAPESALEAVRNDREDILDDLKDLEEALALSAGEGSDAAADASPEAGLTITVTDETGGDATAEASPEAKRLSAIMSYDYDIKMFSPIAADDQPVPEELLEEFIFMEETGKPAPDDDWTDRLGRRIQNGLQNAARDPLKLNNSLNDWVPVIMGIFVPMFALFLRFFYWKRALFLYNQLVFSLHFHTYLFLVLIFFVLAQYFLGSAVSTWLFVWAVPLYLLVALKVASGEGWIRSLFKFSIIGVFYMIGFSLMLTAVFLLGLAET